MKQSGSLLAHWRLAVFAGVVIACAGGATLYFNRSVAEREAGTNAVELRTVPASRVPDAPGAGPAARPFVMFRSTAFGDSYGRVAMAFLDDGGGERQIAPLQCERVHFAGGRGLCLEAKRGVLTTYRALIFDRDFKVLHELPLAGPPSRARVSADGRLAAMTVFVTGHSYDSIDFTTRTSIVDTQSGRFVVDDLETVPVVRDGQRIRAEDFNFWGVTFQPGGTRFYATLGTGRERLLVEGDLVRQEMTVVHPDVECPSLSPDGTRIAFKRRAAQGADGRRPWHVHVLDLRTREEVRLPESRNVDDQVEWNGIGEIAYALPDEGPTAGAGTTLWTVPADGSGPPRAWLPLAFSPAVMR